MEVVVINSKQPKIYSSVKPRGKVTPLIQVNISGHPHIPTSSHNFLLGSLFSSFLGPKLLGLF